jgi:membrane protein YdbS with pleckstrin-like domain
MAKTVNKKTLRTTKKALASPFSIYMNKQNYIILVAAAVLLIVGYFVMSIDPWNSTPAIVISPIILLIVYILIVPAAILYKKKGADNKTEGEEIASSKS